MSYEARYVRAVDPERPRAVWLRHTTLDGIPSTWITVFEADRVRATKHRRTDADGPWRADGVTGPGHDLRFTDLGDPPLRHLPSERLYALPVPRTKLESPQPRVAVSGTVTVDGETLTLDGWPGMTGHNWGAEHAERWIWLHGTLFDGEPDAWLDLAVGRVRLGPFTTPWIANGALSRGGERRRIRGVARVDETPHRAQVRVGGLTVTATSRPEATVVWRYGSDHHVANCSVAALAVDGLETAHGGAYELGMRETAHGLAVQPFADP